MRPGKLTAWITSRVPGWLVAVSCLVTGHHAAADPATAARSGEVVLLDFMASWCGPCRQMAPLVAEIEAAGWLVRHVDVDHEKDLVRRFGVTGMPTYVLVVKGHEVGRINGATTRAELERLLAKSAEPLGAAAPAPREPAAPQGIPGIPVPVAAAAAPLATEPPASRPAGRPAPAPRAAAEITAPRAAPRVEALAAEEPVAAPGRADLERKLLAATARLRVEDAQGVSWATGTVIDCRQGEALILTCGHVFRDSQGRGRVSVDLFGQGGQRGAAGQVIAWDLKRDLALVSIFTDAVIEPIRVGGPDTATPVGTAVVTVGCDGGQDPTLHHSRVTAVNKYLGPSNVQVAGQPVQGRSGGGLFAIDGTLIGVCNAADPADNEGLFAALPSIHEQLDESGLTFVYRNVYPSAGLDGLAASGGPHVPAMPAAMPSVSFDRRDRADAVPTATTSAADAGAPPPPRPARAAAETAAPPRAQETSSAGLSPGEAALIDHVRQHEGLAEVICIVRPHGTPDATSEVFVLKNARSDFVDHLSRAHRAPAAVPEAVAAGARSDVAVLPAPNPVR